MEADRFFSIAISLLTLLFVYLFCLFPFQEDKIPSYTGLHSSTSTFREVC